MYSKNELIKIATEIIDLDITYEEVSKYDYDAQDELLDEICEIKRKVLDDWYERFDNNKTLALFVLDHTYNTYTEQYGTSIGELENYIWNSKNREYKDFIYELQTRILATLSWVTL